MQRDCSGRPLRLFLTFYRPHRRLFALDLLFSLLSCLADLAFPYVSRQAMQNLLPLGHRPPMRRAHRSGYASGAL